ncbi:hypothetical protein HAX54_016788 [Datura stramonium]|uniref:Uncharacterized protein n=1 Tax=Datura stramonium TaxID=4076 RepID=A0ABS8UJL0_DATST|nr:hypothetical protein [Datura stramonium]
MPIVIVQITEPEMRPGSVYEPRPHRDGWLPTFTFINEWSKCVDWKFRRENRFPEFHCLTFSPIEDLSKLLLPRVPQRKIVRRLNCSQEAIHQRRFHFEAQRGNTVKETIIACDKTSPEDVVTAVANIYNGSFIGPEWGGSEEVDMYTSSSLCRFPIQEADFGWGKPCLMHFGSRHNQCCWLYDAECGNGICVQMDLKETNVHLFECEDDIKSFFEF